MSIGKQERTRQELLSIRQRQKHLGRGLRLMYEQVLREPIPPDMIDALDAVIRPDAASLSAAGPRPAIG